MSVQIRDFHHSDYDAVIRLWRETPGVTLRDVDERGPLTTYLRLNPGLSFVAVENTATVGAVLCGTDGRRGYLQHLAVSSTHRHQGVGRALAQHCVQALAERGIDKCHLMAVVGNDGAAAFWSALGWVTRGDIQLMSHTASGVATA